MKVVSLELEALGKFAIDTQWKDLPYSVAHETKRLLLDTIGCAFTGISVFSPPQSAVKIQVGFAAAWSGISVNAAALYAGAASAVPPPTVATIAATVLPVVFAANMIPGVTREQAATTLANALSAANATGGLWVLSAGGTAPIT